MSTSTSTSTSMYITHSAQEQWTHWVTTEQALDLLGDVKLFSKGRFLSPLVVYGVLVPGVCNTPLMGCMQPMMAMDAAQHKIINLLKTRWNVFVITCLSVFNAWPKTTLLLPVWLRYAKRLDTPAYTLQTIDSFESFKLTYFVCCEECFTVLFIDINK